MGNACAGGYAPVDVPDIITGNVYTNFFNPVRVPGAGRRGGRPGCYIRDVAAAMGYPAHNIQSASFLEGNDYPRGIMRLRYVFFFFSIAERPQLTLTVHQLLYLHSCGLHWLHS